MCPKRSVALGNSTQTGMYNGYTGYTVTPQGESEHFGYTSVTPPPFWLHHALRAAFKGFE